MNLRIIIAWFNYLHKGWYTLSLLLYDTKFNKHCNRFISVDISFDTVKNSDKFIGGLIELHVWNLRTVTTLL